MGRVALALGSLWGAGEAAGGSTTEGPGPRPDAPPTDRLPKGALKFNSRLGKYENQKCVFVEVAIPKNIGSATRVEVSVTARLLGGESTDIDDGKTGKVIGWFQHSDKVPTKKAILSGDNDLDITKDIIGKKVLLTIRNAENFGLTVDINLK
jgi:hypothetical protein